MARRKTHTEFIEQVKDRPFDVLGTYTRAIDKIKLRCHIDEHEWSVTPNNVLNGKGCPKCVERCGNDIIADHGSWLEIDVSTKTHKNAIMLIDKVDWKKIKDNGKVGTSNGYAVQQYKDKLVLVHRLITGAKKYIDHINHNKLDNRQQSLRECTNSQNCMNRGVVSNNTSGVTGVSFSMDRGKWQVFITVNYKRISLGRYSSFDDAVKVRKDAEKKHFGEFAYQG